ncbi:hypothetical protein GCM10007036_07910 [Alsobacter metallidurans]|uniref:LTXXQ motif family protein n=1 Tax=Alsobacter metallidurans TaxID=340221 RepID=A0A917I568_9HYPH|nr:Spy/CpxP family protein refolding chaperone [Alsobacter metallidurans]GGH11079.1 hypothetical protein GCM10007036_07910 [Alsobacter metallidurans]
MLKSVLIGAACIGLSWSAAQAQSGAPMAQGPMQLSIADRGAILEARIAATKFALQMTPDQAKKWPPIEEAIRARSAARQARIAKLQTDLLGDATFSDLIRQRADNLMERGASLKKLADAWQPLVVTLSDEQKHRLAVLTLFVLREARELLPRNQGSEQFWEEYDEE